MSYKWQGKKVKVKFGFAYVDRNVYKPLYWYNYDCDLMRSTFAAIPAIKVITEESEFLLGNMHGVAHHKLINGGWPNYTHFSFPDGANFKETDVFKIQEFDLVAFEKDSIERDKWKKKTDPELYAKMESMKELIRSRRP